MFGALDRFPEEKRVPAQIVEARIGASVFVNEDIFVLNGDDACNGSAILGSDADENTAAEARKDVAKPKRGLRGQTVAPTGKQQQVVELFEKGVGTPFFVGQVLAFRTVNFPLHATLVKVEKEGIQAGPKVEHLQGKRLAFGEIAGLGRTLLRKWTYFDVFPPFAMNRSL